MPEAGVRVSISTQVPTDADYWRHASRLAPGFLWPDSIDGTVEIGMLDEAAAAGSARNYHVEWAGDGTVVMDARDNYLGRIGPLRLPRSIQGGTFEWGIYRSASAAMLLCGQKLSEDNALNVIYRGRVHGAPGLPFARQGLGERNVWPKKYGRLGGQPKTATLRASWACDELVIDKKSSELFHEDEKLMQGLAECRDCLGVYGSRSAAAHKCSAGVWERPRPPASRNSTRTSSDCTGLNQVVHLLGVEKLQTSINMEAEAETRVRLHACVRKHIDGESLCSGGGANSLVFVSDVPGDQRQATCSSGECCLSAGERRECKHLAALRSFVRSCECSGSAFAEHVAKGWNLNEFLVFTQGVQNEIERGTRAWCLACNPNDAELEGVAAGLTLDDEEQHEDEDGVRARRRRLAELARRVAIEAEKERTGLPATPAAAPAAPTGTAATSAPTGTAATSAPTGTAATSAPTSAAAPAARKRAPAEGLSRQERARRRKRGGAVAVRGGNAPVDEDVRKSKQIKLCTDGSLCNAFKEHVKGAQEMEEKLRQLRDRDPSVHDDEPATTAARTGGDAYTGWRGMLTQRPLDEILAAIELARNRQALPVVPMPRVRKPDAAMPAFVVLRNALATNCRNYNALTAGYSRVCFDIKAKNVGAEAGARRRRRFDITTMCSCDEFQRTPIGFGGKSKRGGTRLCVCAKLVILAASCKAARMNVSKGEETYEWVDVVLGAGLPPVPPKTADSMAQPSLEEGIPLDEGATDDAMAPSPESESDDWFPALATEADDGAATEADDGAAAAPAQKSTKAKWKKDELKMELNEIMGSAGTPGPLRFPEEYTAAERGRFYGVEAEANEKLSKGHLPSSGEVFPLDELNFSGEAEPTCPSCAGGRATDVFKLSRYKPVDKSEAAVFVGNVVVKRAAGVYFCTNKGHDPEKRSLFYPRGVDFSMRTGLFGVGPKHFFSIALLEEVTANVIQMRTEPSTACAAALRRTWKYMNTYLNDGEQGDVGAAKHGVLAQ